MVMICYHGQYERHFDQQERPAVLLRVERSQRICGS